jgi:3-oxoacyl-[acyl-carrier-protein] synthase III
MLVKNKASFVRISADEQLQLHRFCEAFDTQTECANYIGINLSVLRKVLEFGHASPESIDKIMTVVKADPYLSAVCKEYLIQPNEMLADGRQDAYASEAKFMLIYLLRRDKILTRPQIVTMLNVSDIREVNNIVNRVTDWVSVNSNNTNNKLKSIISFLNQIQ